MKSSRKMSRGKLVVNQNVEITMEENLKNQEDTQPIVSKDINCACFLGMLSNYPVSLDRIYSFHQTLHYN